MTIIYKKFEKKKLGLKYTLSSSLIFENVFFCYFDVFVFLCISSICLVDSTLSSSLILELYFC
ncbi:unnamed protein product [Meloidogyne enterolobii]|uniref:Uncharacterized protein n=1 Tax=Meloidogyne enterolobii TaxID=390850 RepID=A0ACB0YJQ0_MELEN